MSIERVLLTLMKQADLVRSGTLLVEGKLEHFRTAVKMARFPQVVGMAKSILEQELFSTLEAVEAMEECCINADPTELIVQSCLILELAIEVDIVDDNDLALVESGLFEHAHDVEMIAYVRSRLSFLSDGNDLLWDIEHDLEVKVRSIFGNSEVMWEEMLLVLNVVTPSTASRLLPGLLFLLQPTSPIIPKPAATLFLSLVANAVEHERSPFSEDVIRRLLELGASLKISMDCHDAVLERVLSHFQVEGTPWWLKHTAPGSEQRERCPTALNRLLSDSWSPEFMQFLSKFTCCNLDTMESCSVVFPQKMPSLSCLAARYLKPEELSTLPPRIRFDAMKHLPLEPTPETLF